MSYRLLQSLTLYSATGAPLAVSADLAGAFGSVRIAERLGDPPRLTLAGIDGGVLLDVYALVGRRSIVRAEFSGAEGAEVTFWRVREASTSFGEAQAWAAVCDPLWLDLDGTLVSETSAGTGFVDVGVTFAGTVGDVVGRLLSPDSGAPAGLVTFTLGSVEAAVAGQRVFATLTNASTLDGLRQALRASRAEMVFTATDGTGGALAAYTVDVVERIGQDGGARLMAGEGATVNRFSATRKRDDAAYFSHLVATASGDSPITLAAAAWRVAGASYFASENQTALSLDGDPIWEDDALEGLFVRDRLGGPLFEVLATEAPYVVVVDGDASGLDGVAVVFRESGDRDLVALPAAHAAHGRRLRRQTFDVAPFANALVEAGASADLSAWSGGAPVGWSATGGAALALVASEGFVRYGTASVQVTAPVNGGLLSGAIDRLDARTVSAWVAAYVTSAGGRIRLEIVDEDGTVHPVGQKVDSTSETLQALSIGGAPLVGATFRVRIVADSPTATFIVDAATVTRSSSAEPYSERMGPTALWNEAARLLFDEGAAVRPDAIEGRLFDLSGIVSGYDEIRLGDTVTASEEGPNGFAVATRVVELDETFQVGSPSTEKRIRLSQRRADLRARFEGPPPPDPVPVVDPVRRAAPSAQYGVGYRYTAGGDAVVVLTWLGSADVRSVRWTLSVGAAVTTGTANATSGSLELNPGAPLDPGTTIEVRASAYSEEGVVGEVEAAPYRLVTDVPIASASTVLTGRTISVLGTAGEVSVLGSTTQALDTNPSFTLGLADDVRVTSSLGVLGGAYLTAHAATTDHLAVMAHGGAQYGYVVAKGFLIYEGGTSLTRLEGEVVRVSDNLIRLNSDATTPAAWGGVFLYRGAASVGKGAIWNETTGRWGVADISYPSGSEQIETATFKRFLLDDDTTDFARRSLAQSISGAWTYTAQIAAQGGVRMWSASMPMNSPFRFNDNLAAPLFFTGTAGQTDPLLGGYGLWMTWNAKFNGTKWTVERNDATGWSRLVRAGVGYHEDGFSLYSGVYDTVGDAITWTQRFNVSNAGHVAAASIGLSGSATVSGNVTAGGNVGSPVFASGWSGSGWRVTVAGIGELASLTVRGTLSVYELLARRVDAVGGNLLVAPRIKVAAVTGAGPYTITDEFASALGSTAVSDAEVGSFMIAQTATSSGVVQSVVRVTAKSNNSVTVVLVSGAAPVAGRIYVAFDHLTDPSKRGRIYLTSRESGAPFLAVSEGAGTGVWSSGSEKVRMGLLDGLVIGGRTMGDIFLGDPMATGVWGLVTQRALLTGSVIIGDPDGANVSITGSALSFNNAGNALITAVNGGSLTLSASRLNLNGIVTALNGGTFTRITGGAIETGSITGDKLAIAGTVHVGHTLMEHSMWASGAGNIFIGAVSDDQTMPIVRVQGEGEMDVVDMFYEDAWSWGLRGRIAGLDVFQLGSTNAIASWAFTSTRLSSASGGVTTALVAGETLTTYGDFRGLLVADATAPRVLVGDVALPASLAYTPTDRTSTITNAGFEGVTGSATATGVGASDVTVTSGSWKLRAQGVGVAEGQTGTVRTGSRALRLYAPKPTLGDGFGYVPGSYTATASQEFNLTGGDAGRVHRLTMWVRSDGGGIRPWLAGGVAVQARVAGVLVDVASRAWADVSFTNSAWRLVTMDVRVPAGATALLVSLTATSSSDASAPSSVVVYADDLVLSVFDRSVSIVAPTGFATFASPLSSFRASDAGVDLSAVQVQTLGLRLLDAGSADTPPDGQAVMFKRGRDLYVRFADGTEKRVQLV